MHDFLTKVGFPDEDAAYLISVCDKIMENKDTRDEIEKALDILFLETGGGHRNILSSVAEKVNIHVHAVNMAFFIIASRSLRYIYKAKGLSEEVFFDSMRDLAVKNNESKAVYGVVGTYSVDWLSRYYRLTLFGLGRLQYETREMEADADERVKKGTKLLSCHIPSGGPLTKELLLDSLKKAYEFYGYSGPMAVRCGSWLIHPGIASCYKEGSNMKMFYDCFKLVFSEETEIDACWRVFGKLDFSDVTEDDLKTSFQKSYYNYVKSGKPVGRGVGIFYYEPDKGIYHNI